MPYIGTQPLTGQFKKLDSISVTNGEDEYTLQYNGSNYKPATANALLVSVNGVIQAAGDAYTINGSTITFTENLVTGDVIDFIIALGDTGSAVTPVDGSVTTAKLGTDAVTTAKIADGAVDTAQIADDAVTAAKISTVDHSSFRNPIAFSVKNTQTGAYITTSPVPFNSELFDLGGNFDNSSDYDFTCPVDGIYSFTFNLGICQISGSGGYIYAYVAVNGTNQGYQYFQMTATGSYSSMSRTYMLSLSANDTVDVRVVASSASYYNAQSSFSGYLVAET